jgi:hypothetical protein
MSISRQSKRPFIRFWVILALGVWVLCAARVSPAEDFSNFYSDAVLLKAKPVFQEDMDTWFKVIRRHLTPEENQRLGDVQLKFPLRDAHPLNFYSDSRSRTVFMPVLSKVFASDLFLAYLWLDNQGYNPQTILDYAGMVGYYSRKSMSDRFPQQYFNGQFPPPLPALEIPPDAAQSGTVAENRGQKLTDAMIFAFCHELGHVYYGHPSYGTLPAEQVRANEGQADAFAVDILRRVSRAPLGTYVYFMIVAHFNGWQGEQFLDTRTHPLTGTRLQMLASAMEKEPTDFAKNEPDRATWSTNLKTLAGQLRTAAMALDGGALISHGVQVSQLNAENIKERLAPRHTLTYLPRPTGSFQPGKFSGVYDCDIWVVLKGQTEGQIGGGPMHVPPLNIRLVLRRKGEMVEGEYTYVAAGVTGRLAGKIQGEQLAFKWNEPPWHHPALGAFPGGAGTGLFQASEDGKSITGDWGRGEEKKNLGKWMARQLNPREYQ